MMRILETEAAVIFHRKILSTEIVVDSDHIYGAGQKSVTNEKVNCITDYP